MSWTPCANARCEHPRTPWRPLRRARGVASLRGIGRQAPRLPQVLDHARRDRQNGPLYLQDHVHSTRLSGQGDILSIVESTTGLCVAPGDGLHAHGRRLDMPALRQAMRLRVVARRVDHGDALDSALAHALQYANRAPRALCACARDRAPSSGTTRRRRSRPAKSHRPPDMRSTTTTPSTATPMARSSSRGPSCRIARALPVIVEKAAEAPQRVR